MQLDDDFEPTPKAKISAAPGGKGSVSKSGAGGKGGSGRDHNMDLCDRCEDGGVIIMCDGPCQRSFHPACLGMDDKPDEDPWMCNRCSSKVQSVRRRKKQLLKCFGNQIISWDRMAVG